MELTPQLQTALQQQGYFRIREVPGQGICALFRFNFTIDLVVNCGFNLYEGRYQYEELQEAIIGITKWDGKGDPPGNWIKHKGGKGQYDNPNYVKYQS